MIMKKFKRICYLMMMIVIIFCNCILVNAKIDWNQKGSITLFLKDSESHVIMDGEFMLYYVGEIEKNQSSLAFVYNDSFQDNGMNLNNLNADGLADHLANYALNQNIDGISQSVSKDGFVRWNELELGLYLVVQVDVSKGYYPINPFLVSVPMLGTEENQLIYDINASPKVEVLPELPHYKDLIVKKKWVDDGKNTPEYVNVTLFKNQQVYETCRLDKKIIGRIHGKI